jgi:single-stranded-DNA-specific exonuclease
LAEEYSRPTFLICLSGDKGKASSRSYGGFNLFNALAELEPLLEGYGGHALAAGFTISRKNIDEFRRCMCRLVDAYSDQGGRSVLEIDCEPEASALTEENIEGLSRLEPCGIGCPKPAAPPPPPPPP